MALRFIHFIKQSQTTKVQASFTIQKQHFLQSKLNLKLMGINQKIQKYQMKTTSNSRQPQVEDDLKI